MSPLDQKMDARLRQAVSDAAGQDEDNIPEFPEPPADENPSPMVAASAAANPVAAAAEPRRDNVVPLTRTERAVRAVAMHSDAIADKTARSTAYWILDRTAESLASSVVKKLVAELPAVGKPAAPEPAVAEPLGAGDVAELKRLVNDMRKDREKIAKETGNLSDPKNRPAMWRQILRDVTGKTVSKDTRVAARDKLDVLLGLAGGKVRVGIAVAVLFGLGLAAGSAIGSATASPGGQQATQQPAGPPDQIIEAWKDWDWRNDQPVVEQCFAQAKASGQMVKCTIPAKSAPVQPPQR